jgi:hypothetical protein
MKHFIDLKEGQEVFFINNHKIQEGFIIDVVTNKLEGSALNRCIAHSIILKVNHYNDGINFCESEVRLSNCYLTKEELIENL